MELVIVLRSDYKNPQERAKFIKIASTAEPGNSMKVIYDFGHTYGRPSETATQIEIRTNEHAIYATAKEFPMYYTIYGLVFKNY